MNRGSVFFAVIIALASGAFASISVLKYVESVRLSSVPETIETMSVIVAAKEISAGTRIAADALTQLDVIQDKMPEGVFQTGDAVAGRVAKSAIFPGDVIVEKRLVEAGSPAGLSALIPNGFRAITLRVDDTIGVGGFIHPGHMVDVVSTIDLEEMEQALVSKVVLQNIKVIATGSELQRDEASKAKLVPTVTVLATLEQAERLSLAVNAGTIALVLRNHADKQEEVTDGVTLASLLPQANREVKELPMPEPVWIDDAPEPEPENVRVVEVYRGAEKTEVTFKQ